MTFMPETHSLLVSAAFLAAFALIALVTLWQVRDLGVYLWTASGLAGALYSTVSAGFPFGPLEELPLLAVLIGTTILASALCKVIAIRLLAGLDPHWRRYAATWAVLAALFAITMVFGISVSSYISLVSIGIALLVGADAHHFLEGKDKDLAVPDLARAGGLADRVDRLGGDLVGHGDLDLHLRQEVHRVLAAPVDLGVALLAAEALDLRDGHSLDAGAGEGLFHFLDLERLDDGDDKFHETTGLRLRDQDLDS